VRSVEDGEPSVAPRGEGYGRLMAVAVITGAGTGIGRASAVALGRAGFELVLVGRRRDRLEGTADLLGGRSSVVPVDVTDPSAVDALFGVVEQQYGRVDVLFNNAGTGAPAVPMDELDVAHWRQVVDINLTGAFLCARAAMGLMKRQTPPGGRIINNGSISAHAPRPNSAPYTATKHAITGLTKSIALDGRPFGITCGQIDVGNARTDMTERTAEGVLQADGSTRPEPRMDVDDVARAVVFMATLPPEANVLSMTVMAAGMPFVGRG
jgi:NAD(P)-dependent dehydrogenase (short-subunit alcohol dehydrogenase family)